MPKWRGWKRREPAMKERKPDPQTNAPHIVGREAFAKISEAEGIRLSDEAKAMFAEFDRLKLTAEERRKAIVERFKGRDSK